MKKLYIIVGPKFEPEIPKERHVSGTRQPRSDRTNEDSGWPGRVGPPPGAQRAGDIQHTPRAARQRVRQRLHILSGIRRRDACESAKPYDISSFLPFHPFISSTRSFCQLYRFLHENFHLELSTFWMYWEEYLDETSGWSFLFLCSKIKM